MAQKSREEKVEKWDIKSQGTITSRAYSEEGDDAVQASHALLRQTSSAKHPSLLIQPMKNRAQTGS